MSYNFNSLVLKIRIFLKSIGREEIKSLSRESFAKAIGINPLYIRSEHKKFLARILYQEFGVSYKKIAELLAMSMRDIHKAVREEIDKKIVEEAEREAVSVEIQAKAIELLRSGEIKNPNDLVLKLGVSLDVAENLFERILSNERIVAKSVIEVVSRIERSMRNIMRYATIIEDVYNKKINEYKERAEKIIKDLDNKINEMMSAIKDVEKRKEELEKEIYSLGIILTSGGIEIRVIKEFLGRLQELENRTSKQAEELKKLRNDILTIDRKVLDTAPELRGLKEFKEKVEKMIKLK
jgi:rubrerythrin